MPRPDDLLGLLRALDDAMGTLAPPPGHEARMRARLASLSARAPVRPVARRRARPLALVLAAVLALAGLWIAWAPADPGVSVRPLPAPPPTAEVTPEPPAPPPTTPRWLPRRPVPALPILPPRSDRAPSPPDRAPRSLARSDAAPEETPVLPPRPDRASSKWDTNSAQASPARPPPSGAPGRTARSGGGGPWGAPSAGAPPHGGWPGDAREPVLGPMGNLTGLSRAGGGAHGSPAAAPAHGSGQASSPPHNDDPPEPACSWTAVDLAPKCVPLADLKAVAAGACAAPGLVMTDLVPAVICDGGAGASSAQVQCCEADVAPDPLAGCKPVAAGDGLTCTDAALLLKQADSTCASWGGTLAQPELSGGCGAGAATLVIAACCLAPDPGPAPAGALGDGLKCIQDDTLEEAAWQICEAQDLVLVDFYPMDDCDGDASTAAKYICGG